MRNQPGSANGSGIDRVAVALGQHRRRRSPCGRRPARAAGRRRAAHRRTHSRRRSRSSRRCGPPRCRRRPRRRGSAAAPARRRSARASNSASAAAASGSDERLGQLGGDQRGVAPARAQSPHRAGQFGGVEAQAGHVQLDGRGTGQHAAHQHLQPGDVIRRQRPAASYRARLDGRWVADALAVRAAAVSSAPLGAPVVPDVVTTRATSSSISGPPRSAPARRERLRDLAVPAPRPSRDRGRPTPVPGRAAAQGRRSPARPAAHAGRLCVGPRLRADRRGASPWRPAAPAPVRCPSGGRQLVGELADQHTDVDLVEPLALHQFAGHQS